MKNNTPYYLTHLVDLYLKINSRLQRHIEMRRFNALNPKKQQSLLRHVQKLELRLASLGYALPMAGAAFAVAATLGTTTQAAAQGLGKEFKVNETIAGSQQNPQVARDAAGNYVVVWESADASTYDRDIYAQRYNAAGTTVGGEFLVNTYTSSYQLNPTVAMDAHGDFVVAWQSRDQDGSYDGIYAQRFSTTTTVGTEFRVNTYTSTHQSNPTIALDANGDFVVAWQSLGQDGDRYGIYAQRFSTTTTVGTEFRVNTFLDNSQSNPTVAMNADGDFVVAWQSRDQDGSYDGIYAQRFSTTTTVGTEFRVNTYTSTHQSNPTIALDANGDFVVAWQSLGQDGDRYGIYAQRFSTTTTVGTEFRVNTEINTHQSNPTIAMDANGNFVVAWQSYYQNGDDRYGIYAQRYTNTGATVGGEFKVNTFSFYSQVNPSIAMDADGDFVVAWQSYYQDYGYYGIYAQRYSNTGTTVGGEFLVNTYISDYQTNPSVAMDADGDFVVAWQSSGQDGDSYGIYATLSPVAPQLQTTTFAIKENRNAVNTVLGVLTSSYSPNPAEPLAYTIIAGNESNLFALNSITGALSIAGVLDYEAVNQYVLTVQVAYANNTTVSSTGLITINVSDILDSPETTPAGAETRVNTYTTSHQSNPQIAKDATGNYVVVWASSGQDGSGNGIYAQRYSNTGTTIGAEFRVNTNTSSSQNNPTIAMDADGDFVIAWQSSHNGDSDIYAQQFNATTTVGTEFRVNTQTSSSQSQPTIAMDADGDFVVAWQSSHNAIAGYDIYAQRFNSTTTVGTEFRVNTNTSSSQNSPTIAMDADGDFVVAWQSNHSGNNSIYAQRFNNTTTVGTEFRVNTEISNYQINPSIAMDADGDFVIAWTSYDGNGYNVYAQRFSNTTTVGTEFRVNTATSGYHSQPTVAMDANGDFVVAWTSSNGRQADIYAQRYNAIGTAISGEFLVSAEFTISKTNPSVVIDANGDFIVAYSEYGGDYDIYTQRFSNAAPTVTGFTASLTEGVSNLALPLGTVSGSDINEYQTISYAITGGNVGNVFAINSITGVVSVVGTVDYVRTSYVLTVQVADNGAPSKTATAMVTINLIKNNAPTITGGTFTIEEGKTNLTTALGTLLASDPDAGQTLTYTITNGNTGNVFTISNAGVLSVSGVPDFTLSSYVLTVQVADNGAPSKTATAVVTINLIKNNAPTITGGTFTIEEGKTNLTTALGSLLASDPDAGQTLTYTITNGNTGNVFTISNAGVLSVSGVPDFTLSSYVLTVQVADNATPAKTASAVVTINVVKLTSTILPFQASSNINIYPNPTKEQITIPVLGYKEIVIRTFLGVDVLKTSTNVETIDVSSLSNGLYMVYIKSGDTVYYSKFVKE